ncbi:MAG: RNB domain-containing ribonuclease, partial [Sphingopyxis sp.]
WRFTRARVRLAANIAYEGAQAIIDGHPPANADLPVADIAAILRPLWAAWGALARARDARAPLELDLPERQVVLDDNGRIAEIRVRDRLDAHRVVEDFMIAANVASARALESRKHPMMYRVHEPPAREKLVALKEFLATYDISFALGQVIRPATFNRLMQAFDEPESRQRMMEQMLRTQTQAYYSPANAGHFGLALASYGHFTSPIRRYADLLVHRSLVAAFGLEAPAPKLRDVPPITALSPADGAAFARTAEQISAAERRAMEAERETIDRYVAAYLAEHVGEVMETRITGVQPFGFFAQVVGLGGDGLVHVTTLGEEYFRYDEASHSLEGEHSGTRFQSGQTIDLRLIEANPLTGSLAFALPDADANGAPTHRARPERRGRGSGKRGAGGGGSGGPKGGAGLGPGPVHGRKEGAHKMGKRGRPANIRHQSR